MKLIKIKEDHYVVVDDSEIKEGDWYYHSIWQELFCLYKDTMHNKAFELEKAYKITHSTQPLEYFFTDPKNSSKVFRFDKVKYISIQEVKELIGEKSWKGYIDGTEWEVEIVDGKLKLK